jgi:thiamine-monophosphate kinase
LLRAAFPRGYRELALYGGEDYELLFTASADVISKIKRSGECSITVIGQITAKGHDPVVVVDRDGKPVLRGRTGYQHGGWEHFKSAPGK